MFRKTIFLSHSNKDIEKVRKIRDILESLDYEPLLFYLRCLDDDNENLESFIKKEIEARNFFIYCKSKNAEDSKWVKKELEYIEKFDSKRLFTIDIDAPLQETLVQLLQSIADIVKKNRVFISCSHSEPDKTFGDYIEKLLSDYGYDIIRFIGYDIREDVAHKKALETALKNGIFIPIISHNSIKSTYCREELEIAVDYKENYYYENLIFPIFYRVSKFLALRIGGLPSAVEDLNSIEVDGELSKEEIGKFLSSITFKK